MTLSIHRTMEHSARHDVFQLASKLHRPRLCVTRADDVILAVATHVGLDLVDQGVALAIVTGSLVVTTLEQSEADWGQTDSVAKLA